MMEIQIPITTFTIQIANVSEPSLVFVLITVAMQMATAFVRISTVMTTMQISELSVLLVMTEIQTQATML